MARVCAYLSLGVVTSAFGATGSCSREDKQAVKKTGETGSKGLQGSSCFAVEIYAPIKSPEENLGYALQSVSQSSIVNKRQSQDTAERSTEVMTFAV